MILARLARASFFWKNEGQKRRVFLTSLVASQTGTAIPSPSSLCSRPHREAALALSTAVPTPLSNPFLRVSDVGRSESSLTVRFEFDFSQVLFSLRRGRKDKGADEIKIEKNPSSSAP